MLRCEIHWQILKNVTQQRRATGRDNLEELSRALLPFLLSVLLILYVVTPAALASPFGQCLNAPLNIPTCIAPVQVLPMDLDDDGDADLAVRCEIVAKYGEVIEGSGELLLFENIGDGEWEFRRKIGLPPNIQVPTYFGPAYLKSPVFGIGSTEAAPGAFDMHLTDVNGDGWLDLLQVVREPGELKSKLVTLIRTGAFDFRKETQWLLAAGEAIAASRFCVGDLDGRYGADLVISDDGDPNNWWRGRGIIHVYLSEGNGSYCYHASYQAEEPGFSNISGARLQDCVIEDINNDGKNDVIAVNLKSSGPQVTTTLTVLRNLGQGSLGNFIRLYDDGALFIDRLAVGDVDKNGYVDILTTAQDRVIILKNHGSFSFNRVDKIVDPHAIEQDAPIGRIRLSDVEGDGDLDVGILLFGPPSTVVDPSRPFSRDVLTDNWALLTNNGAGEFGDLYIYPTGADVLDLAFADLQGSGMMDALTVAADDNRLTLYYYRQGKGYPRPMVVPVVNPYSLDGSQPVDIASGDFDNDGYVDIAVINNSQTRVPYTPDTLVLLKGGQGGGGPLMPFIDSHSINLLGNHPSRLLMCQLAGGAASDIAITFSGDYDDLGGAPPSFGVTLGVEGNYPVPPNFIPVNAMLGQRMYLTSLKRPDTMKRDIATFMTFESGPVIDVVRIGDAGDVSIIDKIFVPSIWDIDIACGIAGADVDGNGYEDILIVTKGMAILGTSSNIRMYLKKDGDFFPSLGAISVPGDVTDIACADVTEDGLPDIIVTAYTSTSMSQPGCGLWIYINCGSGIFDSRYYYADYDVGEGPIRVAAAPLDENDGLDLVVLSKLSNEVTLLFNDGKGGFPRKERYLTGGGADALTIVDINNDRRMDVVVANDNAIGIATGYHYGTVSVLENTKRTILKGDLNGDGDVDGSDLALFADAFGSVSGDDNYNPGADFDNNNVVDESDLAVFAADFGRTDCID